MPIGKSIFTVNLPLKLFRATVANADTLSVKHLRTLFELFDTYLDHVLARNLNQIVWSEMYKILSFFSKTSFLKSFLTKRRRHFARRF